jgi:hypothetical protein
MVNIDSLRISIYVCMYIPYIPYINSNFLLSFTIKQLFSTGAIEIAVNYFRGLYRISYLQHN